MHAKMAECPSLKAKEQKVQVDWLKSYAQEDCKIVCEMAEHFPLEKSKGELAQSSAEPKNEGKTQIAIWPILSVYQETNSKAINDISSQTVVRLLAGKKSFRWVVSKLEGRCCKEQLD